MTVIDSSGRPLKEIVPVAATTEAEKLNQLKVKYERELERRIETMLDPVLGPGKVVVRSNVQVSLQETQMMKEEFDPDNRVVRSQRRTADDSGFKPGGVPGVQANVPGGEAAKTGDDSSKRSSEAVTYEVGRTTSRISEPRGQLQKISVAVLVDGKYENEKYASRTADEMEVIKGMVKRAIGFDTERGDEIDSTARSGNRLDSVVTTLMFSGRKLSSDLEVVWWLANRGHLDLFTEELEQALQIINRPWLPMNGLTCSWRTSSGSSQANGQTLQRRTQLDSRPTRG